MKVVKKATYVAENGKLNVHKTPYDFPIGTPRASIPKKLKLKDGEKVKITIEKA